MARRVSKYPTELELEILKILWRQGALSVRSVRESLLEFRNLAYTSVLTIMNIMTKKGYLEKSRNGKYYIYAPTAPEGDTLRGIMADVVNRVFEGSTVEAVATLLEIRALDDDQMREMRLRLEKIANANEEN